MRISNEYWSIGQVANLANDNRANAVSVTLTDNAVCTVTGTSLIVTLTIEDDAQAIVSDGYKFNDNPAAGVVY